MTAREEENHLNGINRFITDNRKTREKYKQRLNRTKETVTTVKSNNVSTKDKHQGDENGKSYAEAVKYNRINISNDTVNLSEIYNQLLEDELNNTSKVEISTAKFVLVLQMDQILLLLKITLLYYLHRMRRYFQF